MAAFLLIYLQLDIILNFGVKNRINAIDNFERYNDTII